MFLSAFCKESQHFWCWGCVMKSWRRFQELISIVSLLDDFNGNPLPFHPCLIKGHSTWLFQVILDGSNFIFQPRWLWFLLCCSLMLSPTGLSSEPSALSFLFALAGINRRHNIAFQCYADDSTVSQQSITNLGVKMNPDSQIEAVARPRFFRLRQLDKIKPIL